MKTRIATAISVVGVLGAGSAAALVNTQILDGGPAESSASAAVLPPASTIDVSIPLVRETLPPDTTANTTAPTTEPPAPVPAAPAPSGYLTAFNVGEAGVVTVDVIDGELVLVKTEAKPGWNVINTEEHDNEVEVDFSSAAVRVEFEAEFVDGQIVPSVTSKAIGPDSAPSGTAPANTVAGHEDDDDDEQDDAEQDDAEQDDAEQDDDEQDDDEQDDDQQDDDEQGDDEQDDDDERDDD